MNATSPLRRRTLLQHLTRSALLAACLGASPLALAIGSLADLTVVDRDTGQTLPVYRQDGRHYVAGRPGARYAVSLRNRTGERVLAVVSVDGINVVSGHTAGWNQTGYVLDRWQGYRVAGWRKSDQEVAAFEFAALGDSYAARTGRPANVGVIGVAVFRERVPLVEPAPIAPVPEPASGAPAAPAPSQRQSQANESAADAAAAAESAIGRGAAKPSAKLGTAHGAREGSVVSRTTFERRHSTPDEQLTIWYDSRDNLVAMGVIPASHPSVARPTPFPQSAQSGYVPDPPVR